LPTRALARKPYRRSSIDSSHEYIVAPAINELKTSFLHTFQLNILRDFVLFLSFLALQWDFFKTTIFALLKY